MSEAVESLECFNIAYFWAPTWLAHRLFMFADCFVVRSLAVEWVRFARANTVSPGYMATEISDFIPPETKAIWRDKTPMG